MVTKFTENINPYDVIFGVVIGTCGCLIGQQVAKFYRSRLLNTENGLGKSKEMYKSNALIHSPGRKILNLYNFVRMMQYAIM